MKLRAVLLVLALAFPLSARADRFTVEVPAALDLASGIRLPSEMADLRITHEGIQSAFGIRPDRPRAATAMRAPLVMGLWYLVEGRDGIQYRLILHSVLGNRVGVEILRPGEQPSGPRVLDMRGRYRLRAFTIDNTRAATAYPDLELLPDGRYELGGDKGRWKSDGWLLALEGYYRYWGPADIAADGRTVTFRFFRKSRLFQVAFSRADEPTPDEPKKDTPAEKVAALESAAR